MTNGHQLHLAIIPDGNRRWAKAQMLHPWKGHEHAIENFRSITEWCRDNPRVGVLTVWCFSTENWKRDPEEVNKLMTMLEDYLRKERTGFIDKKTRFVHSGRKDRIPASLASLIQEVEDETQDQTEFTLHLAVDYGGKDEIVRAINNMHGEKIDETSFRSELDHPELPDLDIIIRTSGEHRTSNFFLWQSAYAEWIFNEKLFPDLNTKDLEAAVNEFDRRKRRFGA